MPWVGKSMDRKRNARIARELQADAEALDTAKRTAPRLERGYWRQWMRCTQCRRPQFYDFVPRSFARPLIIPMCGHALADLRDLGDPERPSRGVPPIGAAPEVKP